MGQLRPLMVGVMLANSGTDVASAQTQPPMVLVIAVEAFHFDRAAPAAIVRLPGAVEGDIVVLRAGADAHTIALALRRLGELRAREGDVPTVYAIHLLQPASQALGYRTARSELRMASIVLRQLATADRTSIAGIGNGRAVRVLTPRLAGRLPGAAGRQPQDSGRTGAF